MPIRKATKLERTCDTCGKVFSFIHYPSRDKHGKRRFCSRPCATVSTKLPRICEWCGTPFMFRPSPCRVAKNGGRFCSHKCSGIVTGNERAIDPKIRFLQFIGEPEANGCILWTGSANPNGYGQMSGRAGKIILAPRLAREIANGPIPGRLFVLHKCDANYPVGDISYRRCVNPEHLFLGTNADNSADMAAKGRSKHSENHPHARMTNADILEMRRRHAVGHSTQAEISRDFHVSQSYVSAVILRHTWQHI